MSRFTSRGTSAVAAALLLSAAASAQTFTFDADVEGWLVYSIFYLGEPLGNPQPVSTPSLDGGNGLPPGSLRVGDQAGETWIGATSAVAGNRSDLFGQSLSFDIYYRFADNAVYAAVALWGGGLTLYQPKDPPPLNVWLHWDFPLTGGAWRIGSISGPVATDEQVLAVLGNLQGVFIHTEWRSGPDDTNVDNISLGQDCPADLDGSGAVDGADLGILLGQWGAPGKADLDGSGAVDGADLGILLGSWGPC